MARDRIHDAVKNALVGDGWETTADVFPDTEAVNTALRELIAARNVQAEQRP